MKKSIMSYKDLNDKIGIEIEKIVNTFNLRLHSHAPKQYKYKVITDVYDIVKRMLFEITFKRKVNEELYKLLITKYNIMLVDDIDFNSYIHRLMCKDRLKLLKNSMKESIKLIKIYNRKKKYDKNRKENDRNEKS